jgi:hypothetical protein
MRVLDVETHFGGWDARGREPKTLWEASFDLALPTDELWGWYPERKTEPFYTSSDLAALGLKNLIEIAHRPEPAPRGGRRRR